MLWNGFQYPLPVFSRTHPLEYDFARSVPCFVIITTSAPIGEKVGSVLIGMRLASDQSHLTTAALTEKRCQLRGLFQFDLLHEGNRRPHARIVNSVSLQPVMARSPLVPPPRYFAGDEYVTHNAVRCRTKMARVYGKRPIPRGERLQIMLKGEELTALDDFRFKRRMPTRAAAVRELLKRGLAAEGFEASPFGAKSEDYGVIGTHPKGRKGR
jgi:hypothetical protein